MLNKQEQREKIRRRFRAATNLKSYDYRPETVNYVKDDEFQRVRIYARVSTDNPEQTSSFELQQKYCMDLISKRPKLAKIDADERISGVTMQHREQFPRDELDEGMNPIVPALKAGHEEMADQGEKNAE